MMKFRSSAFELKDVDQKAGIFTGYASVFGNVDSYRDVIERGAFTKTLKEQGQRVKVLYNHDPYSPIGRPLAMKEDDRGLYVEAKVSQTQMGRDTLILMEDGVINELSIGYNRIKEAYDRNQDLTFIQELKLWEFSPVTWAANDLAMIAGVKSVEDLEPFLTRAGGFAEAIKAGKVLSSSNVKLVQDTIGALDAANNFLKSLLEAAGEAGDGKSDPTSPGQKPTAPQDDPEAVQSVLKQLSEIRSLITKGTN